MLREECPKKEEKHVSNVLNTVNLGKVKYFMHIPGNICLYYLLVYQVFCNGALSWLEHGGKTPPVFQEVRKASEKAKCICLESCLSTEYKVLS